MQDKNYVLGLGLIAGAIVIASVVVGVFFVKVKRAGDVISVTGSAKMSITSDSAKFTADFSRTVTEATIKDGYAQIAKDTDVIKNALMAGGITDTEYSITPATLTENYNYDNNGNQVYPKTYTIRQNLTVDSKNIDAVKHFADDVSKIIEAGVLLQNGYVQYFYSKLPDLRVELLGKAIEDAKNRATVIAKNSGSRLGTLQSASSGVVQLLAPNAVDVEDYGAYDTSTKEKDVMMTVRSTFRLR